MQGKKTGGKPRRGEKPENLQNVEEVRKVVIEFVEFGSIDVRLDSFELNQ